MVRGLGQLSSEERLREFGAVQPGEQKAPRSSYCGLSILKEGLQESWRTTCYQGL